MSKHVLIAEDDVLLADMMAKILKKKNVRVTITYNGREALEVIKKDVPDVLLLDVLMPVLDGHAVLKAIEKKQVKCPVIIVSNLSDTKTRKRCKSMGAEKYFVKNDMDDDVLWPAVEKYLQ